jgi:glycosyltransferase involved in cell wall biosynthesis
MPRLRLVIVTPLMPPASGGGGIYTDTLARGLIEQELAEYVCVITETHPDAPREATHLDGRYRIIRRFPFRAGSANKNWRSYLAYGKQNLQYSRLEAVCTEERATAILIHSSLHNNPNLLPVWMPTLSRRRLRLVADVRDPLLPPKRFPQLYPYQKIVACSQSVANHLRNDNALREKLETIPIPLHVERPEECMIHHVLVRHSLQPRRYLLSTNGLLQRKGLSHLLAVAEELKYRNIGITVAIAGKERDRSSKIDALIENGVIRYLGMLPHAEVLSLSAAALANINLSPVEGMPRTTLETIAVGGNVIISKGIPEFDALSTDAVVDPRQTATVADLVQRLQFTPVPFPYDISQHHVSVAVRAFHRALS